MVMVERTIVKGITSGKLIQNFAGTGRRPVQGAVLVKR